MANTARDVVRAIVERFAETTDRALHAFDRQPPKGEEFLRRLLPHLPGMAYRRLDDEAWTLEFVSRGCRALTGFAPEDLIHDSVVSYADLVHPEDRQSVRDAVQDAIVRGSSFQVTYRIRRVDGEERLVREQGSAVVDERGAVEALEGFVTDITEQAAVAVRPTARDLQYRALVEQSSSGITLIRGGRFQYANPRVAEILGYGVEELLEIPSVLEVVHPEDRDLVANTLRKRVRGKARELPYEIRAMRKDGTERFVEVHARRVETGGEPAVVVTLLDITDRKRRERRYHEAQKMEALGRLSAGVAHDLNNFLALNRTTAEVVLVERQGDETLAQDLSGILQATERGAALSRELVNFGRPRAGTHDRVAMGPLVRDLVAGLRRLLGSEIEIDVCVEPDLPDVAMDPTHVDEIVMNLVLNARDAMPSGGTLSVALASRSEGTDRSPFRYRRAPHVVLEVADTGSGIPPEVLGHVFEPYFTTKGAAGTGLGLANVWRIVHDAGGVMEVDAEPGSGATFRTYLPAYPRASLTN
jgi:PAS domain S-box-containing protein